jgi:hypothetical protein
MTALLDPPIAHWPVSHDRTLVRRGKPALYFYILSPLPGAAIDGGQPFRMIRFLIIPM